MNYEETIKKINNMNKFGIKPGLDRVAAVLKCLDNPQNKLKFIHVAGTNGKGSICAMIASILAEAGYKTGLFMSPFIVNFRESMSINRKNISKNDVVRLYNLMDNFVSSVSSITKFEIVTAMAFQWFKEQEADLVVLETGLGGRFDSTNIIDNPLVSVIGSISYDHTNILGNDLKKIAKEKCGIIKPGGVTVMYPKQDMSVFSVVENECKIKKNLMIVPDLSKIKITRRSIRGTDLVCKGKAYKLPLVGEHQVKNLSVVFSVLEKISKKGFKISEKHCRVGLEKVKIPARFEIVRQNPMIILDGAHNFSALDALVKIIENHFKKKKILGIFSMLKDKDYVFCTERIALLANEGFIVTEINSERSCEAKILAKQIKKSGGRVLSVKKDVHTAILEALKLCDKDSVLIIFGSFYLSREARKSLGFDGSNFC
ncbi:MAG: bifunctional folylpolyglutamate synthase/dihydrofolate synthase [Oscillospiraceae bacterium]|nr:bifunctional folylpolyglutamate synthase/dihydrofolate synthase [Oscillospiraceae bacterium]